MPARRKTAGSWSRAWGSIRISSISTVRREAPAWEANQCFKAGILAGSIGKLAVVIVLLPFGMALAEHHRPRGKGRKRRHRPGGVPDSVLCKLRPQRPRLQPPGNWRTGRRPHRGTTLAPEKL